MSKQELTVIPMQGEVIVTALKKPSKSEGGIIVDAMQPYLEEQRVLRVGRDVSPDIMEGDIVKIRIDNFAKHKYEANSIQRDVNGNPVLDFMMPVRKIQGHEVLILNSFRDIDYLIPVNEAHPEAKNLSNKQIVDTGKIVVPKGNVKI